MAYRPPSHSGLALGLSAWLRSFDLAGRSTRSEVIGLILFNTLCLIPLILIEFAFGPFEKWEALAPASWPRGLADQLLGAIASLPLFALASRRLHDIGLPGWPGPLLVLSGIALGIRHQLFYTSGGAVPELSGGRAMLHFASALGVAAVLFWTPQRRTNPYGPDPRLDRELPASELA